MDSRLVLIVDDSDLVAGVLEEALSGNGFSVMRARNGMEGVEMAYRELPAAIIMDVEMPLMQGYQASRLLKNRRGIRDIPIIMHTSLSEDRDKYWAVSCGADAFINKDFDNLDQLMETVKSLAGHPPYDEALIAQDGEGLDHDRIFEIMGSLMDAQLFRSTVLNLLAEAGRSIGSPGDPAESILRLLPKVCEPHLAVLMVKQAREILVYVIPSSKVYRAETEDFLRVCNEDFYSCFPSAELDGVQPVYLDLEGRTDFDKLRLDGRKLSSYYHCHLIGTGGGVVGTLHIGNLSNNYFSDRIVENLGVFADGAGTILENSVLYVHIRKLEAQIRHVFSKFVPAEIIDDLLERKSDEALMVGEKRNIVVLFSDIRSFTTISENNSPEDVVSFLNNHFSVMVEVVKKYGGSIDKFIGDAIFAIFGAPISHEDNAFRAVSAAAEMIGAMGQVDTGRLRMPQIGYAIGIGLHQGPAIVGNIGSRDKFDYTAIGDTVNIASRLEGLTKHYGKRILVSEDVAAEIKDSFDLREVDRVKVKGKLTATSLFSIENVEKALPPDAREQYDKGLKLYKQGNWETALDYFRSIRADGIEDTLVDVFISRCEKFLQQPPSEWDGAVSLDFK